MTEAGSGVLIVLVFLLLVALLVIAAWGDYQRLEKLKARGECEVCGGCRGGVCQDCGRCYDPECNAGCCYNRRHDEAGQSTHRMFQNTARALRGVFH